MLYRQIGSLSQFINELEREGIGDFRTMDDIRSFYNNCKNSLKNELEELKEALARNERRNMLMRFFFFFRKER